MALLPNYFNKRIFHFSQSFSSVNLTTSYVQVTAGGSDEIHALWVSFCGNSASPAGIEIAVGAAASEVVVASIAQANTVLIPFRFGPNTRIAIRTQNGSLSSGDISITGWQSV